MKFSWYWLAVLLLAGTAAAETITVVEEHRPRAAIVVEPEAPPLTRHAARELQQWLEASTGARLPLVASVAEVPTGMRPVLLGDSAWARSRGLTLEHVGSDGFRLEATPEFLWIGGRDYAGGPLGHFVHPMRLSECYSPELGWGAFGEAGTLYGVYYFLEKYAGIRWYMTGELGTVVPQHSAIEVEEQSSEDAPDFEYRYPWFCNFPGHPEDALWFRRAGYGGAFPVGVNHSFLRMQKYTGTHPEYFALIDGERDFHNRSVLSGGNYCLTNPALEDAWVEEIGTFFEQHPEQTFFPLAPMDGMHRICECAACSARLSPQLGENGKFSNYVWGFADRVARRVLERAPGKIIGTLAYEHYAAPPDDLEGLSPNLAVMLCKNRQNLRDPEIAAEQRRFLELWHEKADRIYVWSYPITDYWPPMTGVPSLYSGVLQSDLQHQLRHGVRGEFLESEFTTAMSDVGILYPGLSHLTAYLTAKLLWHNDRDVPALLEEYYRLFYGPAEAPMRHFWERVEQIYSASHSLNPADIYQEKEVWELTGYLEEALATTEPGSVYARRIQLIREEMKAAAMRMLGCTGEAEVIRIPVVAGVEPAWLAAECLTLVNPSTRERAALLYLVGDPDSLHGKVLLPEGAPPVAAVEFQVSDAARDWTFTGMEWAIPRSELATGTLRFRLRLQTPDGSRREAVFPAPLPFRAGNAPETARFEWSGNGIRLEP